MKQNNKKTFRVIFLLVIGMSLIAWMPVPAMATTWHVYDGESINDYTGYNGAYWGVVSTGDTIFVHNGTYYGTFDIDKPNLTVIGEGSDFVTYDGEGTGQVIMPNGTTAGLDATGTILEGFEFINSPYGAFIGSYGPATDCKIRNNVFEGLTASGGLTTYDLNITIENNVFSNCIGSWCALYVGFGVVGLSDFSTIANNTFTNNTGSRALTLRQASYCNVVNNTIINNAGDGIRLYKTTANNNTITRNNISSNGGIICLKDAGEGNKLYLNNFVNNPGGVTYSGTSPAITYWNSISQIVYVYNGTTYTGQMGNYWGSDYTGTDADGDGIGDTPYPIPGSATDCDSFPLIAEFDYNNYLIPDFNLSGYVDASDLQLFGDHWHFTAEDSLNWDPIYNLEHTPVGGYQYIDAGDLQVFGDNWHQGTPPRYGSGGKSGKGPNEFAGIVFDLDATTYGNQNLTDIPSQPAGTYIRLDVYCTGVQNLDTYEFEVIYDPTELAYVTATPTNPITMEGNILESNGGTALGWMIDTSTPGVLSIAYTLTGTDPAQAPEGEGLIADIVFQALVATYGTLTFGDVYFYDSYGVVDLITDTGTATLPVELAAFTATYVAENGYTSIYWATASETDVNGFNVYRNTEEVFGTAMRINYDLIPGYGTTSEPKEYTFIDDNPVVFETTYYYWLESVDFGGETHIYASISLTPEEGEGGFVNDFNENRLGNHPNPFKGSTTIEYGIKGRLKAEPVEIRIYNVAGQLIETIEARYGTAKWNVDNLPTGVYFYQLKTENYNEVKKMLLVQ